MDNVIYKYINLDEKLNPTLAICNLLNLPRVVVKKLYSDSVGRYDQTPQRKIEHIKREHIFIFQHKKVKKFLRSMVMSKYVIEATFCSTLRGKIYKFTKLFQRYKIIKLALQKSPKRSLLR